MFDITQIRNEITAQRQNPELCGLVFEMMQRRFGSEFNKKYAEYQDDELIMVAAETLAGLTPDQIKNGLDRMRSEQFCPTLPRFRALCEMGFWMTADLAWVQALKFTDNPKTQITVITKQALDDIRHILNVEGQKAAHFAFKSVYEDYIEQAKALGQTQQIWVDPRQDEQQKRKQLAYSERNRKGSPIPEELKAQVAQIYRNGRKFA